jgi:hypothetical protein
VLELTGNIGSFYRKKGGSIGNHVLRTVGLVTRGCCDCFPSARNLDADCIKQVLVGKDRKVVEKDALLTAFGLTRFRKKMRGNSAVRKWAAAACNNMQQQTHLQVKGPMSLPLAKRCFLTTSLFHPCLHVEPFSPSQPITRKRCERDEDHSHILHTVAVVIRMKSCNGGGKRCSRFGHAVCFFRHDPRRKLGGFWFDLLPFDFLLHLGAMHEMKSLSEGK